MRSQSRLRRETFWLRLWIRTQGTAIGGTQILSPIVTTSSRTCPRTTLKLELYPRSHSKKTLSGIHPLTHLLEEASSPLRPSPTCSTILANYPSLGKMNNAGNLLLTWFPLTRRALVTYLKRWRMRRRLSLSLSSCLTNLSITQCT